MNVYIYIYMYLLSTSSTRDRTFGGRVGVASDATEHLQGSSAFPGSAGTLAYIVYIHIHIHTYIYIYIYNNNVEVWGL